MGAGPAGGQAGPRTHACERPHTQRVVPLISSHQRPAAAGDFRPRIIYGQGQDTRAHSSWPSPGPPRTTNKVTGGGELDPDLVKQLGRQISTTAKPDTLAQLSLEGRNETNRISVDLPNQR